MVSAYGYGGNTPVLRLLELKVYVCKLEQQQLPDHVVRDYCRKSLSLADDLLAEDEQVSNQCVTVWAQESHP